MFLGVDDRDHQRLDFFFFFFFGITFLTTFLAFLTTFLAALTTRFVTDFFFDFLAIVCPSAFGFRFLGFRLLLFSSFLRSLFLFRSFCCFRNRLGGLLDWPWGMPDDCLFGALGDCLHGSFRQFPGGIGNHIGHLIDHGFFFFVVHDRFFLCRLRDCGE